MNGIDKISSFDDLHAFMVQQGAAPEDINEFRNMLTEDKLRKLHVALVKNINIDVTSSYKDFSSAMDISKKKAEKEFLHVGAERFPEGFSFREAGMLPSKEQKDQVQRGKEAKPELDDKDVKPYNYADQDWVAFAKARGNFDPYAGIRGETGITKDQQAEALEGLKEGMKEPYDIATPFQKEPIGEYLPTVTDERIANYSDNFFIPKIKQKKEDEIISRNILNALTEMDAPMKLGTLQANKDKFIDNVVDSNRDKEFVQRIQNPHTLEPYDFGEGKTGTHYMMSTEVDGKHMVLPTIVNIDGKLQLLDERKAIDYALNTGEYIEFDNETEAKFFAENYKRYWMTPSEKTADIEKNELRIKEDLERQKELADSYNMKATEVGTREITRNMMSPGYGTIARWLNIGQPEVTKDEEIAYHKQLASIRADKDQAKHLLNTEQNVVYNDYFNRALLDDPLMRDKVKEGYQLSETEKVNLIAKKLSEDIYSNNNDVKLYKNSELIKVIDEMSAIGTEMETQKSNMQHIESKLNALKDKYPDGLPQKELAVAQQLQQEYSNIYAAYNENKSAAQQLIDNPDTKEDLANYMTVLQNLNKNIRDYQNLGNVFPEYAKELEKVEKQERKLKEIQYAQNNPFYASTVNANKLAGYIAEDFGKRFYNSFSDGIYSLLTTLPRIYTSARATLSDADYTSAEALMNELDESMSGIKATTMPKVDAIDKDGINLIGLTQSLGDQSGVFASIIAANYMFGAGSTGVVGQGTNAQKAFGATKLYNNITQTVIPAAMVSYKDYYDSAVSKGLRGMEVFGYAAPMAAMEGISEMMLPNQKVFTRGAKSRLLKQYADDLVKGVDFAKNNLAKHVGKGFYTMFKNAGLEVAEEGIVMLANYANDYTWSLSNPDIQAQAPTMNEMLETALVAGLLGGGLSAPGAFNNRGARTREQGLYTLAKNYDKAENIITSTYSDVKAQELLSEIKGVRDQIKNVPEGLTPMKTAAVAHLLAQAKHKQDFIDNLEDPKSAMGDIVKGEIKDIQNKISDIIKNENYEEETTAEIKDEANETGVNEAKDVLQVTDEQLDDLMTEEYPDYKEMNATGNMVMDFLEKTQKQARRKEMTPADLIAEKLGVTTEEQTKIQEVEENAKKTDELRAPSEAQEQIRPEEQAGEPVGGVREIDRTETAQKEKVTPTEQRQEALIESVQDERHMKVLRKQQKQSAKSEQSKERFAKHLEKMAAGTTKGKKLLKQYKAEDVDIAERQRIEDAKANVEDKAMKDMYDESLKQLTEDPLAYWQKEQRRLEKRKESQQLKKGETDVIGNLLDKANAQVEYYQSIEKKTEVEPTKKEVTHAEKMPRAEGERGEAIPEARQKEARSEKDEVTKEAEPTKPAEPVTKEKPTKEPPAKEKPLMQEAKPKGGKKRVMDMINKQREHILSSKPGKTAKAITDKELKQVETVMDAIAASWAKVTKRSIDDFYDNYIGDIWAGQPRPTLKEAANAKGSVQFAEDGLAYVRLFTNADVSTLLHEFAGGHLGRRVLEDLSTQDPTFAKQYNSAMIWAGVVDGVWDTRSEEKFARAWERYMRRGISPTQSLTEVFNVLREHLKNIYKTIVGTEIEVSLPDYMVEAFDNIIAYGQIEPDYKVPKNESVDTDSMFGDEEFTRVDETVSKWKKFKEKLGKEWAKWMKVGGTMPKMVREFILTMEGQIKKTQHILDKNRIRFERTMDEAARNKLGYGDERLNKKQKDELITMKENLSELCNDVIQNMGVHDPERRRTQLERLPKELREPINRFRNEIDHMSELLLMSGAVEDIQELSIDKNMGFYITRSYRKWDDKNWNVEKLPKDVVNHARSYLKEKFPDYKPHQIELLLKKISEKPSKQSRTQFLKSGMVGSKDLSILKKKNLLLAPKIRALMGEYTDVYYNYSKSIMKMTELVEKQNLLQNMKDEGMGKILFTKENATLKFSEEIAAEGSEVLKPLNGLYTTPEIAEALRDYEKSDVIDHTLFRMYLGAMSIVKYNKTILSAQTHVRNFLSNFMLQTFNGRLPFGKAYTTARKAVANDFKRKKSKKEWEQRYQWYIENNIIKDSSGLGEVKSMMRAAAMENMNYDNFMKSRFDKGMRKYAKLPLRKGLYMAEKLYQAEDDFHKIVAFEVERKRYERVYITKANMSAEEAAKMADKKAIEIVRSTMPTYSLVPKIGKALGKFWMTGSFVSFPMEIKRVAYNSLELSFKEMADPVTRDIGIQRFVGQMSTVIAIPVIASTIRTLLGFKEDDEDKLRGFLAPWSKHSDLIQIRRPKDGVYSYIDFGGSDPFNIFRKTFRAFWTADSAWDAFIEGVAGELVQPYLSTEIAQQVIQELRYNKQADTGRPIWTEGADVDTKLLETTDYLQKKVMPGTITSLVRIAKAHFEISDSAREYDPNIEWIAMVSGQRMTQTDVAKGFKWKLKDYSDKINAGLWLYTKYLQRANVSEAKLNRKREEAERMLAKYFAEINTLYNDAIALGGNEEIIDAAINNMTMAGFPVSKEMKYIVRTNEFNGITEEGDVY